MLLGRKAMTNLDSIFKSRDITLPTKFRLVKAMVFPVVMYGLRVGLWRRLSTEELMLLNCGVGEGSWEDEMAGLHHGLNGLDGGLACCNSWGCKESDTTEWLNWTEQAHEKNAQHHSLSEKCKQNHNKLPSHASQNGCYQKVYKQ